MLLHCCSTFSICTFAYIRTLYVLRAAPRMLWKHFCDRSYCPEEHTLCSAQPYVLHIHITDSDRVWSHSSSDGQCRVLSQVRSSGIWIGEISTGAGFLRVFSPANCLAITSIFNLSTPYGLSIDSRKELTVDIVEPRLLECGAIWVLLELTFRKKLSPLSSV